MKTTTFTLRRKIIGAMLALAAGLASASAATFTTNALITEADTSFDGQDIVVSGATLTVDGRHSFNSLLLTNGAVLTHPVPPYALGGRVGGLRRVRQNSR